MSESRSQLNALLDVAIEERTDDQKAEVVSLSEILQNLDARVEGGDSRGTRVNPKRSIRRNPRNANGASFEARRS